MEAAEAPGATVIVPTARGGDRLARLLDSLADRPEWAEVVVVDNASGDASGMAAAGERPGVTVLALDHNVGFGRAVNRAARASRMAALVVLNDDCVCSPGFVPELVAALDPGAGITMAAGVMTERSPDGPIDTAGIQLDHGLFAFDYLNGRPLSALAGARDPIGPSGAAAAYAREAFLAVGGFDERIFAYLEDVDLAVRMRLAGGGCALAPRAVGVHEHSATLGSGSPRKDYLMGFGRGYLLRKWGVLRRPARAARALAAEAAICSGQLILDRTTAGVRGRLAGFRAAAAGDYPDAVVEANRPPPGERGASLIRRLRRRRRVRSPRPAAFEPPSFLVVLHAAELGGPLRSLQGELRWLADAGTLTVVLPAEGPEPPLPAPARVVRLPVRALTLPGGPLGLARELARIAAATARLRRLIAELRPAAVLIVTTMLPGELLAARLARAPVVVYAAELHRDPSVGRLRRALGRALLSLTARLADVVIACSEAVAAQFEPGARATVEVAEPPIDAGVRGGDGSRFRAELGLGAEPLLLVVGNVTRGRGQDALLRAVPEIEAGAGAVSLVSVGACFRRRQDIEFRAELESLAAAQGTRLVLAGERRRMADAFAAASVVVNPATHPESFGRVACEALVAGVPVVATRVGAVPETLAGLGGTTLVEPDSPGALAAGVLASLRDGDARERAAAAGETVLARYSPDASLAVFSRVIRSAARL